MFCPYYFKVTFFNVHLLTFAVYVGTAGVYVIFIVFISVLAALSVNVTCTTFTPDVSDTPDTVPDTESVPAPLVIVAVPLLLTTLATVVPPTDVPVNVKLVVADDVSKSACSVKIVTSAVSHPTKPRYVVR